MIKLFLVLMFTLRTTPLLAETPEETNRELFWKLHLEELATNLLSKGSTPFEIPELSVEVKSLKSRIENLYGTKYLVCAAYKGFSRETQNILCSAGLEEGKPVIDIILPSAIHLYETLGNENKLRWRRIFEATMTVYIIHELHHLARGHPLIKKPTAEQKTSGEAEAWGDTCEKVISAFSKNKIVLTNELMRDLSAWEATGKQRDSPRWKEYIRQHKTLTPEH